MFDFIRGNIAIFCSTQIKVNKKEKKTRGRIVRATKMAQSFREIVRNDDSLLYLLSLIDKNAIGDNGEIRIGDFQGTW